MDINQSLGQPVGKVTTTYNGEKVQVNVYADRSVVLPDGTIRKVKQEVVDALIAKNKASAPASAPAPVAQTPGPSVFRTQNPVQPQPAQAPSEFAQPTPVAQAQSGYQAVRGVYQEPTAQATYPQQPVAPTASESFNYSDPASGIPMNQINPYPAATNAQPAVPTGFSPAPAAPAADVPVANKKKGLFHKGNSPVKDPVPPQPAPQPSDAVSASAPVEKKKKSKAGVVIAAVLAVAVAGGALGYAFVPAVYDGVNGVLSSVTGTTVGVPPVSGESNSMAAAPNSISSGKNALEGVDLSGAVTIDFYATIRTADGMEYKVPLSSANLTDGTLTSLLDGSGFTLATNNNTQ